MLFHKIICSLSAPLRKHHSFVASLLQSEVTLSHYSMLHSTRLRIQNIYGNLSTMTVDTIESEI